MNTENSLFFEIQEVSEFFGISIATINRLVKEGEYPKQSKNNTQKNSFYEK